MPDYEFYKNTYGGTLPEETFMRLAKRSAYYVESLTMQYAAANEAVQMAICAVCDAMSRNESGGQLVSESVGSWSCTFATGNVKSSERLLYDAAMQYLAGSGFTARWC